MPGHRTLPDPHRDGFTEAARRLPPAVSPCDSFETIYARYAGLLRYIARVRFRIAPQEADGLVQDVFMKFAIDYLEVRTPREWLVAAISNACRNHIRDHMRETSLPDDAAEWEDPVAQNTVDSILSRLAIGTTLKQLGDRCREILYRFHVDGQSTTNIAEALGSTAGYIQLRLHLCRKRARTLYKALTKVSA